MPEDTLGITADNATVTADENLQTTDSADTSQTEPKPKYKYKSNGIEKEAELEELLSLASKADGADQKFKEAAEAKRQIKNLEARLGKLSKADSDNWEDIIETVGWDKAQKFANTLVRKQLEWEELNQDQRDRILEQQEGEDAKARLRDYESREHQARATQERSLAIDLVDKEVSAALAAARAEGLPIADAPRFAEQVVDELLAYLEYLDREEQAGREITVPPPNALDVARSLQQKANESTSAYVRRLKTSDLRSMLTPEQLRELRQADLDDLYAPIPRESKRPAKDDAINPFDTSNNPRRKKSGDWFKAMEQKLGVK